MKTEHYLSTIIIILLAIDVYYVYQTYKLEASKQ